VYKLKTVIDGLPDTRKPDGNGSMASGRYMPIPIDSIVPIDEDPKSYLEGRVAFYIALLEELIRRGADRGDIYFMKECVDALLKMTTIGRAKVDMEVSGGLSKLRDEIDFSNMSKDDLEAFVAKAKGEANGRTNGNGHLARNDGILHGLDDGARSKVSSRRRKSSRHNDRSGGEAGANVAGDGPSDSTPSGPGSVAADLP